MCKDCPAATKCPFYAKDAEECVYDVLAESASAFVVDDHQC